MESPTLPTRSQAPATRPRTPTRTGSPHSPTTSKPNLDDLCAKERKQIAIFINIYDIIYGRPIFSIQISRDISSLMSRWMNVI